MDKLGEMVNRNQLDLNQFLTMHPFSATESGVYDSALKGIDFFKELYVKNNKTYERLATVCHIINNAEKNLVVITGYRGCGKTNFLRLIEYIANTQQGGLETLDELENIEICCAEETDELVGMIKNDYEKTVNTIKNLVSGELYDDTSLIRGKKLTEYFCKQLSGKCKYINFDEGGMGREKPFSTKLFYNIRASIDRCGKEGKLPEIMNTLTAFISRNKWIIEENFVDIEFTSLQIFLEK